MTDRDGTELEGSTTAAKGTAVPVEVSAPRSFKTDLALFLAGPLIWTGHFMIVYLVAEAGCTGDGPGLDLFDPPVPAVFTIAATAIGVLACVLTARLSYRRWRETQRKGEDDSRSLDPAGAGALAFTGYLLSLLACIVILFVGLPALVVAACAA